MRYFDTNVLIHFIYQYQDELKHKTAKKLIEESIISQEILISPLVFQEFVYSSFKIDKSKEIVLKGFYLFESFIMFEITKDIIVESFRLAEELNYFQNINDCIHIKFAERHCKKLVTFDKDFEKFRSHTKLEIEILN